MQKKTVEIRISYRKKPQNWQQISINDKEVISVNKHKLLGFTINDQLNWNDHIEAMLKKANKRMYFIRAMIRAEFSKVDIILFFCASIRSILEYGATVWHFSITKQQSDDIEGIQKRVIKMVEDIPYSEHDYPYVELLEKYNLTTLEYRRFNLCRVMFNKMCKNNHPLNYLIPKNHSTHRMLGRNRNNYIIPLCKTERYKKSFIPSATKHFM
jgi:hypothetical protein